LAGVGRPPPGRPEAGTPPRGGDAAAVSGARKIGLFGGSFDPVHDAHLALARQARDQLALDQLRWVPTGAAWQKARSLSPGAQREAMLRLAIESEARFVIERCELQRAGPSYTLDTLRELQAAEPAAQWFLVIGQDQYRNLHTWHGIDDLLPRVTLAVAQRPGSAGDAGVDPRVRAAATVWLTLPPLHVSASDIRARVAAGLDIGALVPPAVALYIRQQGLYRAATGS
jgi:nicotinate-nucleotide adenylyltransferase